MARQSEDLPSIDLDIDAKADQFVMSFPEYDFRKYFETSVTGSLNVAFLTALLHPLDRAQIVKQIQSTYSNQTFKTDNSIASRCFNSGLRATYRGLKIAMLRNSILFSTFSFWDTFEFKENQMTERIIQGLFVFSGYLLAYPLQNIKVRMQVDIERDRFYANVRQCVQKIRKYEGSKKMYQGFGFGLLHFSSQLYFLSAIIKIKSQFIDNRTYFSDSPLTFGAFFLASFISYELFMYPLDTLKKHLQINGAMGHQNTSAKATKLMGKLKFSDYYRGLPVRMTSSALYAIASLFFAQKRLPTENS